jgi:hypothetical protein
VHVLAGAAGPKLAWTTSNGYALVVPQAGVPKLSGWASRSESDTLAKDTGLPASLQRLPAERDAIIYVPPGSKEMLALPITHVVLTLSLAPTALALSADAPWGGDQAGLSLFEPKPGDALLGLLPNDAFLVARFSGEAGQLAPLLKPLLGPHLTRAFEEGGFDVKAQVLDNLKPGAVLGLSLAPTAQMGQGVPQLDVRRTNPFTFVHLSGAAAARSAEAVPATLEKLAALAPRFGAKMELKDGVYVTTYSQGEGVHVAAKSGRVLFGSPLGRVAALLSADASQLGPVSDAKLKAQLEASAVGAVIDLRKLSDAVRELPASAWGVGGFAIKATTLRWLDNSDDLKAVTASVGAKAGAVQARVELLLTPGGAGPADGGVLQDAGR